MKDFNPFGSHIPVLIGLGMILKPKKVLELGAGLNSTPLFLDRLCFGELEKFQSIENDKKWFDDLRTNNQLDTNNGLYFYEGKIADYVRGLRDARFDLILIDDSYETADRVETIKSVFQSPASDSAVVLIHDFETAAYQEAAKMWPNHYSFLSFIPNVGVVWKDKNVIDPMALRTISRIIGKNKWRYSIYDRAAWIHAFK